MPMQCRLLNRPMVKATRYEVVKARSNSIVVGLRCKVQGKRRRATGCRPFYKMLFSPSAALRRALLKLRKDLSLNLLGHGFTVFGIADRSADDDVISAILESHFHTDHPFLVVLFAVVDRSDAGCDN